MVHVFLLSYPNPLDWATSCVFENNYYYYIVLLLLLGWVNESVKNSPIITKSFSSCIHFVQCFSIFWSFQIIRIVKSLKRVFVWTTITSLELHLTAICSNLETGNSYWGLFTENKIDEEKMSSTIHYIST